ncbi:MAG TPA: helix-turn-helix transcriptional regulator [Puia sp.]
MDRGVEKALQNFGRRLTELRQQQNLTISELSVRSGLDSQLIGQIEAGLVDFEMTVIIALAQGLGVRAGDLLS